MAKITSIQTGAERAAGRPGRPHNEDLHQRMQTSAARTAQSRANVEHLTRTGRWPQ